MLGSAEVPSGSERPLAAGETRQVAESRFRSCGGGRKDDRAEALGLLTALARRILVALVLASFVLLLCGLLGADSVLRRGREILSLIAFGALLYTMGESRHLGSHYGICAAARWRSEALLGLIGGAGIGGMYVLWACLGGLRTGAIPPAVFLELPRFAFEALVAAALLQVVFAAYALGLFRPLLGLPAAILLTAMIFGLFESRLQAGRFVGYSLAMVLLLLLRLLTGSIVAGTGFLAGWVFVKRAVNRLGPPHVAGPDPVRWHDVFALRAEPLEMPMMWICLVGAIAVFSFVLVRRGERPPPEEIVLPPTIAKMFPFALPHVFAPLDVWLGRLFQARFHVGAIYLTKLGFALTTSAANTALVLPERLLLPPLLRRRRIPDPVFIVGTFRSGTTLLHNLLALDPQFVTPRYFQVLNPWGCAFSGWLLAPLLGCMPNRRPMDNMRLHLFAPAEEEFAIANLCGLSPYWGFTFPRQIRHYERFVFLESFRGEELRRWERHYLGFLRRILLFRGGCPLLKSPFNTARVPHLISLFPGARFIHVRRNPYEVVQSNLRMAESGFPMMQLQDPEPAHSYADWFAETYLRIEGAWETAKRHLPEQRVSETRYEDLVADPMAQIRRIYADLGLAFSAPYSRRLEVACLEAKMYRANPKTPLSCAAIARINVALAPLFERWGYPMSPAGDDAAPS